MARIHPATAIAGFGVLVIGLAPRLCAEQSAQSASLVGKVTDQSGGAMAGITVTLKSPALQVPQVTTVTGADGDYRILELPPGVYTVKFELAGFQTSARADVHLTTGSAGRVDVVMKIGALSETVQVSGSESRRRYGERGRPNHTGAGTAPQHPHGRHDAGDASARRR